MCAVMAMFHGLVQNVSLPQNRFMHLLFPDWSLEDVEDVLRELGRNGFLDNSYADDTIYDCSLSDVAIVKMENQKKETLLTVADFISKFIP